MEVLFISHYTHSCHMAFAESIGAKIKKIPFRRLLILQKKIDAIKYIYPFLCLIYGIIIKIKEEIILIDGGSSLWVGAGIKIKNPKIKAVYLDADPCIFKSQNANKLKRLVWTFAFKKMNYIISTSEMNKKFAEKYLGATARVCNPYPQQILKTNIERKNYGLFVGRIEPDKNIERILDFSIQCPYLEKFILIGWGALKERIKDSYKNNKKILFLDYQKELSKYYSQCKFLIHLSEFDAFGCTILEAASCGCYPIISKNCGAGFFLDKIFIIDNPDDFNLINKKINFILENQALADSLLKKTVEIIPNKETSIKNFQKTFWEITKK